MLLKKFNIFLLTTFLLINFHTWGKDCDMPDLRSGYETLYKSVDAHRASRALSIADSLLQIMKDRNMEDCELRLWVLFEKGEAQEILKNDIEGTLLLYYDLIKEGEKVKNWVLVAETYISIARTHEFIGRPKDCLRNLENARKIIDKLQLYPTFSRFAARYSSYHRIYDNPDTARVYGQLAIDYGTKYNVTRSILDGNMILGMLADNTDETVAYFDKVIELELKRETYYGAAISALNVIDMLFDSGREKEALQRLHEAFQYAALISKDYIGYYEAHMFLYDIKQSYFRRKGMNDSAIFYLQQRNEALRYADYYTNQEKIQLQEVEFAIEREQEKIKFEKKRANLFMRGMAVFALLTFALLALFLNNERKKRLITQQQKLILDQNDQLNESLKKQSLLLSEIHHRVKNNLQLVISLLVLKGHKVGDQGLNVHFEDVSSKIHSILLIHEQLYKSSEFEMVQLGQYFSELCHHFKSLTSEQNVHFTINTNELVANLETVIPLGIICSELISNSLKHAQPTGETLSIAIDITKNKEKYEFKYKDNGMGYPDDGKMKNPNGSMGGMLINSMTRQLRGTNTTYNDNGAVFQLNFEEKITSLV